MAGMSRRRTRRLMSGRAAVSLLCCVLAVPAGFLVGSVGVLFAFAITVGVVAVLSVAALCWAEHRQTVYRRWLGDGRTMDEYVELAAAREAARVAGAGRRGEPRRMPEWVPEPVVVASPASPLRVVR